MIIGSNIFPGSVGGGPAAGDPECVVNGAFDTDMDGWTDASEPLASVVWQLGKALMSAPASGAFPIAILRQTLTVVASTTYTLLFTITGMANFDWVDNVFVGSTLGASDLLLSHWGDGANSLSFVTGAAQTTVYLQFQRQASWSTVDDVSVLPA